MAALSLRGFRRLLSLKLSLTLIFTGSLLWIFSTFFASPSTMTDDRLQWLKQQTRLGDYVKESFHGVKEMLHHREVKVVGLVFYGRRVYFDILDCYLRKNLALNGGWLDEIHFAMHTDDKADIDHLERIVKRDSLQDVYKILYEDYTTRWGTFPRVWQQFATDEDTLYVKMDDDLVFLDVAAVPRIITSLLAHPEAFCILGNSINNRWNHWFHHGTDAVLPYLPERYQSKERIKSWRASALPPYPIHELPETGDKPYIAKDQAPPFKGHRWLPLPREERHLLRTPFGDGAGLPNPKTSQKGPVPWQFAAQEHYSFLEHLENNNLDVYAWGRPSDGLWNTHYQHYNIHFMAFWGRNIKKRPFWGEEGDPQFLRNDEVALTMTIPKELAMPVYVDTRAIVGHFAFHDVNQRRDVLQTDLLERYRLLANEQTCAAGNQKEPLDHLDAKAYDKP